jgi:hypothetical protein
MTSSQISCGSEEERMHAGRLRDEVLNETLFISLR